MNSFNAKRARWSAIGAVAASALVLSAMSATPAFAATNISGQVLDAGVPTPNVSVYIYGRDPVTNSWTSAGNTTTDASGNWTIALAADGTYATRYAPYGTAAPFAGDQAWNGSPVYAPFPSFSFTPQFTVTGGVSSSPTLAQTLIHNAGVVKVRLTNPAGTVLTGDAADGFGSFSPGIGFNEATGLIVSTAGSSENNEGFDGTVDAAHQLAGAYLGSTVDGEDIDGNEFESEVLDGYSVTAGQVTDVGSVALAPNGAPDAIDLVEATFKPTVTGTNKVGGLLTASKPAGAVTTSYQWIKGTVYPYVQPVVGAKAQTYSPTANDLGSPLNAIVIFRAPGHRSTLLYNQLSGGTVGIGDPNAPAVAISGSAKLAGKLRVTATGGIAGATNAFQWYRNGAPIADADGSTYTVTKADLGASIFAAAKSVVQGHTDSITPSAAVVVAKESASVKASTDKTIKTSTVPKVKITVKPSKSDIGATAKVKVYYTSKKFKSVTVKSGKSATVKLPKLKKGTTTLKIVYPGTAYYKAKTVTIKVKVSK